MIHFCASKSLKCKSKCQQKRVLSVNVNWGVKREEKSRKKRKEAKKRKRNLPSRDFDLEFGDWSVERLVFVTIWKKERKKKRLRMSISNENKLSKN